MASTSKFEITGEWMMMMVVVKRDADDERYFTDNTTDNNKSLKLLTNKNVYSEVVLTAQVQIPLYSIILLLSIIGNALVISTLVQNKRMRTVTNVHLLNLAISDLLLGVFCMPFTLVGSLLRDFIFGEVMCKLIPYLQAVSVAVSAWTLVAISVERYHAICHPFRSRRWQTLSHAHKIIATIWVGSLLCMLPIAILSVLQPIKGKGRFKCREDWPSDLTEKAFNIFLDVILLVIPLLIMVINYSLITVTLRKGIRTDEKIRDGDDARDYSNEKESTRYHNGSMTKSESSSEETLAPGSVKSNATSQNAGDTDSHGSSGHKALVPVRVSNFGPYLQVRSSNVEVSLANKKRVIKMLFVVVLEYFICWAPLYTINTLALFDQKAVYQELGTMGISFFQLIAYVSSCCNPITYCFMNSKFKHAFLSVFDCPRRWHTTSFSSTYSKTNSLPLTSSIASRSK